MLSPHVRHSNIPLLLATVTENRLSFEVTPREYQGKIEVYLPWSSFSVELDGHCKAVAWEGKREAKAFTHNREARNTLHCRALFKGGRNSSHNDIPHSEKEGSSPRIDCLQIKLSITN